MNGKTFAAPRGFPPGCSSGFASPPTRLRRSSITASGYDGSGYYGARGDDLPLAAHFLIVADAFDAMTTDRPYRPRSAATRRSRRSRRNAGTQFHPVIAKAFVAVQRGERPADVLSKQEL